jgi:hypothetical protein
VAEMYLVHVDNWFDHKWLGWWSSWEHNAPKNLYVPPFNPNRVLSQQRFVWDADSVDWVSAGQGRPLHRRQPGRRASFGQPLERYADSAAFIWYSGNTAKNRAGSLMFYFSARKVTPGTPRLPRRSAGSSRTNSRSPGNS